MDAYEITQALLSVGTVFDVRRPREEGILYSARGEIVSATPKFRLVESGTAEGKTIGDLTSNFLKTKYEVHADGKLLASLVFPAVAFKKTVTLTVGETAYAADGGVFKGLFRCRRAGTDDVALEIAKELSIRDTFLVRTDGSIPLPVALLSVVAIHSRFYEMV